MMINLISTLNTHSCIGICHALSFYLVPTGLIIRFFVFYRYLAPKGILYSSFQTDYHRFTLTKDKYFLS
jgi:hypothetical protein